MTAKVFDKNLFYLRGNFFYRRTILKQIKDHFRPFELSMFDERASFKYVEQKIMEHSCFEDRRLIILNNWPSTVAKTKSYARTKTIKSLKKIISNIPEDCILILNNLETTNKSFLDEVKAYGRIYKSPQEIDRNSARKKILGYFNSKQKVIKEEDINSIIKSIGFNIYRIDLDKLFLTLSKIEHYVGNRKNIKTEDIMKVCMYSGDFIIWSLYNALDKGNICQSLYLINMAMSFCKNVQQEVMSIINSMMWRYKLLLFVKECQLQGIKQEGIWRKISNLTKLEREGLGFKIKMKEKIDEKTKKSKIIYSEKIFDNLFKSFFKQKPTIESYTRNKLLFINYTINQSILKIRPTSYVRTGFADAEAVLILQILCMVICGLIKKASTISFLSDKSLLKVI